MKELLEFAKGKLKEEDLGKFEELTKNLVNMSNVKDIEAAVNFINNNDILKRGMDSTVSKIVDSHDTKFNDDKLPGIRKELEDSIRKELNPEETQEMKLIRELRDEVEAGKREKANSLRREALRIKAKEIGYDPDRAERYVSYGEDAEKFMTEDAEYFKTSINSKLDEKLKENNITSNPPKGEEEENVDFITKMSKIDFIH